MSDSPSAPAPVDYTGAANATAAGNLDTAKYTVNANRVNQYSPLGSSTWSKTIADDGNEIWTQKQALTDTGQNALDSQLALTANKSGLANNLYGQVADTFSTPFDPTTATTIKAPTSAPTMDQQTIDQAQKAAYNQSASLLQPQFDQQTKTLDNKMALQGLAPTSEAYQTEMGNLQRQHNSTYANLANQSVLTGDQAGINQFNAALSGTQSQQNLYNQQLQNALYQYNMPLNTVNALTTGSQVQMPTFGSYAQQANVNGADLMGAATAQGQQSQSMYNAEAAAAANNNNATISGIGTAAMAAAMFY